MPAFSAASGRNPARQHFLAIPLADGPTLRRWFFPISRISFQGFFRSFKENSPVFKDSFFKEKISFSRIHFPRNV
jgi:hypothetical protein